MGKAQRAPAQDPKQFNTKGYKEDEFVLFWKGGASCVVIQGRVAVDLERGRAAALPPS